MKILIVHNRYLERGGEDVVAEAEAALLRQAGHQVDVYSRDNRELAQISTLRAAAGAVWSRRTHEDVAARCAAFRPDVAHFHNTFPLVSAAAYSAVHRHGGAVVQTVHNFRLLCPQGSFLREEKVCQDCRGRLPWRGVQRGCYRDSPLMSAVVAAASASARLVGGSLQGVDAYIALTHFGRNVLIDGGLPAARIHVKPNFVEPGAVQPDWEQRSGGLYVGRLAPEKGVRDLIEAARLLGDGPARVCAPRIKVVGGGPLQPEVGAAFGADYLGPQAPRAVREIMNAARYLIAPSTCLETFGLAVVEGYAQGLPAIVPSHGGLGELVEHGVTGLHYRPGSVSDLAARIAWAEGHPEEMQNMGRNAYRRYLQRYTPQRNAGLLEDIYREALARRQGALARRHGVHHAA